MKLEELCALEWNNYIKWLICSD